MEPTEIINESSKLSKEWLNKNLPDNVCFDCGCKMIERFSDITMTHYFRCPSCECKEYER